LGLEAIAVLAAGCREDALHIVVPLKVVRKTRGLESEKNTCMAGEEEREVRVDQA
jgi:hypothetical protein